MNNDFYTDSSERNEWIATVIEEQRRILASRKKDPVQILMDVFELFDENFDMTIIREIKLYDCLTKLYENNKKTNLYTSLEEHFSTLNELARIFYHHKKKIREFSIELFYALLNFIDLLKRKGLYFRFSNIYD